MLHRLLLIALLFATFTARAEPELTTRFTDQQLIDILKEEGYESVKPYKENVLLIKVNGRSLLLFNNDDGDLQAYYGASGVKVNYEDINEWNRDHRLSRAYLDTELDPVLESDLMSNAGLLPKHVTEFFNVFRQSTDIFRAFLLKKDRS